MRRAIALALGMALVGIPATAQDDDGRPRVVSDEDWCRTAFPGATWAPARKRCIGVLTDLWSNASDYVDGEPISRPGRNMIPEAVVAALAFFEAVSLGLDDGQGYVEWSGAPRPTPEPTPRPTPRPVTIPGNGHYLVGREVAPGVYRSPGPAIGHDTCFVFAYYPEGSERQFAAAESSSGPVIVTIPADAMTVETANCQTFVKV